MNDNIFNVAYEFIYCTEFVDALAKKIIAMLKRHSSEGHPRIEVVQAMNLAMARMVIDASQSGYVPIEEMKQIACRYLVTTIDKSMLTKIENTTKMASLAYAGRA